MHTHNTDIARVTLEETKRYTEAAMDLFHAIGDDARGYSAFSLHKDIEGDMAPRSGGN